MFRKSPLFAFTAVLALTLGIGANTAIFSVINAVLLKPMPFPEPDTLIQLIHTTPDGAPSSTGASPAKYLLWREQADAIEDVAAYRSISLNYTAGDIPERLDASQVTAPYFRTFRIPLALGRSFTLNEDLPGAARVAVVSHEFWTRRLGSNPDVVGATLPLSGIPHTIVGVTAAAFDSRDLGDIDVWVPFQLDPNSLDDGHSLKVAARLRSGVSLEQAQARLAATIVAYWERFPMSALRPDVGFGAVLFQDALIATGSSTLFRNSPQRMLWLLLGAVSFVLLIACANVASLLMIRASARAREFAVRAALGASRWRIAGQVLTESAVLFAIGGAAGLALGFFGMRAILAIDTAGLPRLGESGSLMAMDWRVVAFTGLVSIVTAIAFGMLPAFAASRTDLNSTIRYSSARSGRAIGIGRSRAILVVGEIALSIVLLIGAALLIRTTIELYRIRPGFNVDDVVVMRTSLTESRFHTSAAITELSANTLETVRAIPNVEAAAASCCVPLHQGWGAVFKIIGRDDGGRPFTSGADITISTGDYFDAFEIPVVRGRVFDARDDSNAPPVIVINRALAERWWPDGQDPLGQRMSIGAGVSVTADEPVREVIGVVEDVRKTGLDIVRPIMYVPLTQISDTWLKFNLESDPLAWIVRANIDPMQVSAAAQDQIRQATGVPVTGVQPMKEIVAASISRQRANMLLMTVFGGVALLLAAIGLYGVVAYSVQQRNHEIGIRMALGAKRERIVGMVVRQGMLQVIVGIAIGLAVSFFLAELLASLLFGVEPRDTAVFVGVPLVLMLVSAAAISIPACRASRVDPLDALRYE